MTSIGLPTGSEWEGNADLPVIEQLLLDSELFDPDELTRLFEELAWLKQENPEGYNGLVCYVTKHLK